MLPGFHPLGQFHLHADETTKNNIANKLFYKAISLESSRGHGMDNDLFQRVFLMYALRANIAIAVFTGIVAVFVLLMYWNAEQLAGWAGGLVFALQTTNEPGITAGIVAVGGMAIGLIAVGGLAVGILAIGGGAVGMFAFGGAAAGLVAIGGGAVGLIAVGGGAVGYITLGAGGIGRYVMAMSGLGRYLFTLKRQDREAVELFCRWLPRLRQAIDHDQ